MLVDDVGDVTITNDGATILQVNKIDNVIKIWMCLYFLEDIRY